MPCAQLDFKGWPCFLWWCRCYFHVVGRWACSLGLPGSTTGCFEFHPSFHALCYGNGAGCSMGACGSICFPSRSNAAVTGSRLGDCASPDLVSGCWTRLCRWERPRCELWVSDSLVVGYVQNVHSWSCRAENFTHGSRTSSSYWFLLRFCMVYSEVPNFSEPNSEHIGQNKLVC